MTGFICKAHDLASNIVDHCPRCWELDHDKEKQEKQWQPPTPTLSDLEPSIYRGILGLERVINQTHVLRSHVAGICCDLLTNFHQNTGTETTERQSEIFASFARLLLELEGLLSHAKIVAENSQNYQSKNAQTTSEFGKQRKN